MKSAPSRYALRPPGPELFVENRRRFRELLPPASLAIFQANDVMPSNADGTLAFRQNNDLFYLSGVDQEESILVVFPTRGWKRCAKSCF